MKHLARVLVFVMVALAVPLQGALAVAAVQCMTLAHHEGAPAGHDHAAHSHAGDSDDSDVGNHGDSAHCGPCTACCASASIAGPEAFAIASAASTATYVFSQFPPLGVQPDGLDRPPLAL